MTESTKTYNTISTMYNAHNDQMFTSQTFAFT